ncbi:MAG: HIT domain-containing protein [Alphaproteobacteria bacterium]|nr:HIT domain-containing protein [Alphaproteobacteria bacterium]
MFALHPILEKDTVEITRLPLCRVLLMRDKTYPWVILVPEREGLRDLDDLKPRDMIQATAEIDHVSKAMKTLYAPDKMNVAALGNVVEQLHIHVIARFKTDPAWPAPVWGKFPAEDYGDAARDAAVKALKTALA